MNRQQKKALILLAIALLLYLLISGYGLAKDDGAMATAMRRVDALVADTRRDIQKEMDKPFILRLFGSLFGMEGNSFARMERELPEILAEAMPSTIATFSDRPTDDGLACESMRLLDALAYLAEHDREPTRLWWRFDDTVDDIYIALPGQILAVRADGDQGAELVLQMRHEVVTEDGLGSDRPTRQAALAALRETAAAEAREDRLLRDWLVMEDPADRQELLRDGVPLDRWAGLPVQPADDTAP